MKIRRGVKKAQGKYAVIWTEKYSWITGAQEVCDNTQGLEIIFKETMVENFSNPDKDMSSQVQDSHLSKSMQINPYRNYS